jgi:hypothetical protein
MWAASHCCLTTLEATPLLTPRSICSARSCRASNRNRVDTPRPGGTLGGCGRRRRPGQDEIEVQPLGVGGIQNTFALRVPLILTEPPRSGAKRKTPSILAAAADGSISISKIREASQSPRCPEVIGRPVMAAISSSIAFRSCSMRAMRPTGSSCTPGSVACPRNQSASSHRCSSRRDRQPADRYEEVDGRSRSVACQPPRHEPYPPLGASC